MNNSQLINQTSGEVEYYTPPEIIEAARRVMGFIDLDPACSDAAAKLVKPDRYYYKEALTRGWDCQTLWMNHPFSQGENPCKKNCKKKICRERGYCTNKRVPGNKEWVDKLVFEYENGRIKKSAMCITYACTSEKWFLPLLKRPQCYLIPRTNYLLPDGSVKKGVPKGSAVTYFGQDLSAFYREFSSLGVCHLPLDRLIIDTVNYTGISDFILK